jgi:hypothetical protein
MGFCRQSLVHGSVTIYNYILLIDERMKNNENLYRIL